MAGRGQDRPGVGGGPFPGLEERRRVVGALVLREAMTRFGRRRGVGVLWTLLEPMLQAALLCGLWLLAGRTSHHSGIQLAPFIVAGLVPYTAFSRTMSRCMGAIDANRQLFVYPVVRPLDAIAARVLLEGAVYFTVLAALLGACRALGLGPDVPDALLALGAFWMAVLFGAGLGTACAAAALVAPAVAKVVPLANRLLFWGSCVFFSLDMLPQNAVAVLRWNPLVQITECSRAGLFARFDDRHCDPAYLAAWCVVLLALGVRALRAVERMPNVRFSGNA